MAKSKKALKALKRRKEAKGRSRVLKERQDYTGGGRVKANVGWAGIPTNIPTQEEIQKQVEEASKQNQQKQEAVVLDEPVDSGGRGTGDWIPEETPTGTPPAQDAETDALAARQAELQRLGTSGMDTDGDGRISQAERYAAKLVKDISKNLDEPVDAIDATA